MVDSVFPEAARDQPNAVLRAVRGGSLYVGLTLLQRVVPFLVLPVLATALSPSEYGHIASLAAVMAILGALLGLGLEPWVVRTYVHLRAVPDQRASFLKTVGLFALAVPALGALVAGIVVVAIPGLRQSDADTYLVWIALLGMAAQVSLTTFLGAVLRAQERLAGYAAVALIQGVGGPLLSLALVVGAHLGPSGWFLAGLCAAMAAVGAGLVLVRPPLRARTSWAFVGAGLAFGLPLLPHAVSHWVLSLSDRLVLTAYVDPAAVGVYNLAYQLVAPMGLMLIALRQGFMPLYAAAQRNTQVRGEIGRITTVQVHLTGLLGLAAAAIGPGALWLLFPSGYHGGEAFVPWIALGYVLFGLYLIPVDSLSLMLGRTRWIWVPTFVAAIVNVVMNVQLVPILGAQAAAIDTAAAYGCLLAGIIMLRRLEPEPRIGYDAPRMAVGLIIAGVAWLIASTAFPSTNSVPALAGRFGVVMVATILVLAYDLAWWRGERLQHPTEQTEVGAPDGVLPRLASE